ncbi:hypothetical protein ACO0LO_17240 [Undibacterium sp. TJN25]|uniref:hypothetical protein n=1 Tax=Undibacterium sp. TJN25 TaxID=3413056 RepID=UPI003BF054DD
MATTPVKKIAAKTKAPVVPAKKIVAAAAKAPAAKAATNTSTSVAKPAPAAGKAVKAVKKPVVAAKPIAAKPVIAKPVAAKPAAGKSAAPAVSAAAAAGKEKAKKAKLVRDSFTMPESEYEVLSQVKKACISAGVEVKKSQLLRIGLVLLKKTDVAALKNLIAGLEPLKAGRPKKEK